MHESLDGAPHVGDVIGGKYVVERIIGTGGMAVVVAARHTELGVLRAIKVPCKGAREIPAALERFKREAWIAAQLRSEHVARVYDTGRLEDGTPFIVMEHLEGCDLGQVVRNHGALPAKEAVLCVLQACDAMQEAHAVGIIHRDLKPSNLFLTTHANGFPCVKVIDFGVAKMKDAHGSDAALTRVGEQLGSPAYMAPEQRRAEEIDARTDVFALGAILYELVTGQRALVVQDPTRPGSFVLREQIPPPSTLGQDIPRGLEEVILWCLERDPGRRLQSIAALKTGIAPFGPRVKQVDPERTSSADDCTTTIVLNPVAAKKTTMTASCEGRPVARAGLRRWRKTGIALGAAVVASLALVIGHPARQALVPSSTSASPLPSPPELIVQPSEERPPSIAASATARVVTPPESAAEPAPKP